MEDLIRNDLNCFFNVINHQLDVSSHDITQTPQTFFGQGAWDTLIKLSSTAILPLAFTILSFCLALDLYRMYEKNNGSIDIEVFALRLVEYILPFLLISNTYGLLDAISKIVNASLTKMSDLMHYTPVQLSQTVDSIMQDVHGKDFFGQLGFAIQILPMTLIINILGIIIFVIVVGRMFEIAMMWIVSPIPTAFLINSNERQTGTAFYKQFFAVLLQGFLMLISLYLFNILATNMFSSNAASSGIGQSSSQLWYLIGAAAVLVFALTKTGSLAKRIVNTF
jgi:hypothetical protein